jgi:hypothetical protein
VSFRSVRCLPPVCGSPRLAFADAAHHAVSARISSVLQSCCYDRSVEVVRHWSFKVLPFASTRVTKTQLPCMQHLAREIFSMPRRVDFVTQHRITKMMQMHPNLMCAATVQFAFNQTRLLARTKNAIFSSGRATAA